MLNYGKKQIQIRPPLFFVFKISMLAFAASAAAVLADLAAAVTSSSRLGFDFFAETTCYSKTAFRIQDFNLGKITF